MAELVADADSIILPAKAWSKEPLVACLSQISQGTQVQEELTLSMDSSGGTPFTARCTSLLVSCASD